MVKTLVFLVGEAFVLYDIYTDYEAAMVVQGALKFDRLPGASTGGCYYNEEDIIYQQITGLSLTDENVDRSLLTCSFKLLYVLSIIFTITGVINDIMYSLYKLKIYNKHVKGFDKKVP